MADKQKKETTPPPLLLMPAGGGLTLTPPDRPDVLMPVIQSEPSLFGPEDDSLGEADSFVGQSPQQGTTSQPGQPLASSFFHNPAMNSSSKPDPFSQIGPGTPPRPTLASGPPVTPGQLPATRQNIPPLAPTSHVPMSNTPKNMAPPMPNTSGLAGLYRKHGSSRYAQMPEGTYAGNAGVGGPSPANLMAAPPAPTPFTPNFSTAPTTEVSYSQNPGTLPPQPSIGQLPGMGYVPNATETYIPVDYHWCVCKNVEGRDIWYPFSMADSIAMDDAFKAIRGGTMESAVISTDGGRYDVNVSEQRRYAVYWEEVPKVVRRCSWFFKREGDNRYVPYEESFAIRLEEEYKSAVTTGVWHKPLQFDSGETVVMHNPNVMVHYQPSSQPDEWGNVQGDQMRPRVVKRGVADFESIEEGESRQIDHLVFIVHGIGSVCDLRFRSIIECVDDFRTIGDSLVKSHFSLYKECNRIGRVEFLPIQWHQALHGDATGIDKRLRAITLPSTVKLRNFVNDTLMDVLFYTSPTYCQCIADTVGQEMNRLLQLFLVRNPTFKGGVSVAGHSLGSCILFDLLQHQGEQADTPTSDLSGLTNGQPEPQLITPEPEPAEEPVPDQIEEEPALSLAELLAKVGLEDKQALFEQEQIDMEALIMCSDSDLKDLGLPMGPRKKLQGFLREEGSKKDTQKLAKEKREKEEADRQMREKLAAELAAKQLEQQQARQNGETPLARASSMSINYIVGVGGTGHPHIKYTQLKFDPTCCFALGSPVGLFLSARGVEEIGDEFRLPTCPKYFNIFHPFDPVAYRLEPLINPASASVKPVLMQHHKGRKRLHLELKESLARMGSDIKQKIIDSFKSTWQSINSFARAHQSDTGTSLEQQVESEMSQVVQQLQDDDTASVASTLEEDLEMGQLNEGRRVDHVLQERPIESFNDYMFSLTSHGCYWNSEDTVLLVLKEIYALFGIAPSIPGADSAAPQKPRIGAPPRGTPPPGPSFTAHQSPPMGLPLSSHQTQPFSSPQSPAQVSGGFTSVGFGTNSGPSPPSGPPQMYSMPGTSLAPSGSMSGNLPPPSGPPPFMGQSPRLPAGPPPMTGFVKKS